MQIVIPGHVYKLEHLDGSDSQNLSFVNRNKGQECAGTTNQEVLRVLIDRIKFLDGQVRWELNDQIIWHLRMAIALHEARAIIRKVEKNKICIEDLEVDEIDLHIKIKNKENK